MDKIYTNIRDFDKVKLSDNTYALPYYFPKGERFKITDINNEFVVLINLKLNISIKMDLNYFKELMHEKN